MSDQTQRQQALDIQQSFIVQAPAGSGKTELLTQRFLALLANVQQPEHIVALTFTRKAAAEMRQRILQALHRAQANQKPTSNHEEITYQLAETALKHNNTQEWHLLKNPNRLRIMTIDALCASITRQMPLLTSMGTQATISDDPYIFYQEASRRVLTSLGKKTSWETSLQSVLLHLDNQHNKVAGLFNMMLACRDHWLPHVVQAKYRLREELETGLQHVILDTIASLASHFTSEQQSELLELTLFAANNLLAGGKDTAVTGCSELSELPGNNLDDLTPWLAITELLLRSDNGWRKAVNKNIGFPAPSSAKTSSDKEFYTDYKQRMQDLLSELRSNDELQQNLTALRHCPPPRYTDQQWEILQSVLELLPVLVAQLQVIFSENGQVDFVEVAQNALNALGEHDAPTDLALRLDHKIQHLLIDEFQDTSITQFRLLQQLTAGWQENDSRTLFLVGDPMQSIYRFRQAEVGLFIYAQQHGLDDIRLQSLTLKQNFRSDAGIIEWINTTFDKTFPAKASIDIGAIPYSFSEANKAPNHAEAVNFYACHDSQHEAMEIINIVKQNIDSSIAILVRSRLHLIDIIPALQEANLDFQAHELESLSLRPVIQDLWALTRALLHPGDRLAWLSVLRAPWCGLDLHDLYTVTESAVENTVWDAISHATFVLKESSQQRLQRLVNIFQSAFLNRQRQSVREWVQQTWLQLAGPACLTETMDLNNADNYFHLLGKFETAGDLTNFSIFENKLNKLYAAPNNQSNCPLQIMTIHKAKGLEFDTVILPSLARSTTSNSTPLLMMAERQRASGENDLLLAPIKSTEDNSDKIYQYLRELDKQKELYEIARLFYVATTRAKQQLHLLACFKENDDGDFVKPRANSLIAASWEQTQAHWENATRQRNQISVTEEAQTLKFNRLSQTWLSKNPIQEQPHNLINANNNTTPTYSPNDSAAIGSFIHQILQTIAETGLEKWTADYIQQQKPYWLKLLNNQGLKVNELFIDDVAQAIIKTTNDQRGQWVLNNTHTDNRCEWALTANIENTPMNIIIDRSFIDETGTRWIIDYKTTPCHENIDNFLKIQQQIHQPQLEQYAKIISLSENCPIRLGLYYPFNQAWCEWEYGVST